MQAMTIAQINTLASERGYSISGNKTQLIARFLDNQGGS